jgi:uncharacterized protein (DUF2237 family)
MNYILVILILILIVLLLNNSNIESYQNTNKNLLGTDLIPCSNSNEKTTGYFRDGNCLTGPTDTGTHIVCAVVDDEFLKFTKCKGNDLITPSSNFPGLVAGDKWCLCILRWIQAYKAGKAPKIIPESTFEKAGQYISKDILLKYAVS